MYSTTYTDFYCDYCKETKYNTTRCECTTVHSIKIEEKKHKLKLNRKQRRVIERRIKKLKKKLGNRVKGIPPESL